jgi:hypothetical protein
MEPIMDHDRLSFQICSTRSSSGVSVPNFTTCMSWEVLSDQGKSVNGTERWREEDDHEPTKTRSRSPSSLSTGSIPRPRYICKRKLIAKVPSVQNLTAKETQHAENTTARKLTASRQVHALRQDRSAPAGGAPL